MSVGALCFFGKEARECEGTSDHQVIDICFPLASEGLTDSNTICLNHNNFNLVDKKVLIIINGHRYNERLNT